MGWREHLSPGVRRRLAALWPWVFAVAVMVGLFLFVGAVPLVYLFDWGNADLYLNAFYLVVVTVILSALTGMGCDLGVGEG